MTELLSVAESCDQETFPDELLVALAQGGLYQAEQALMRRYLERISRLVNRLARRWRLGAEDTADACQEAAAFWFPKAVHAYDLKRYAAPRGCRFATLLDRVVVARLQNFARGLRRQAAHTPRELSLDRLATKGLLPITARPAWATADPVAAAADREQEEQVHDILAELPEPARALWAWRAAGGSLRAWAQQQRCAYAKARCWWTDLLGRLTARCMA